MKKAEIRNASAHLGPSSSILITEFAQRQLISVQMIDFRIKSVIDRPFLG